MGQPDLIGQLMQALCCLPGVGPKTAQRMTFYMLERDRQGAKILAEILHKAVDKVIHCKLCRTLTEHDLCGLCASQSRDHSSLCIVETPADVFAIEQAVVYKGLFFVLHGCLSPLDGIGPEELRLELLEKRLQAGGVKELILATNSTVEGEATAHFISEIARRYDVSATRLAYGIPLGGELEYVDSGTLSHAFSGRKNI